MEQPTNLRKSFRMYLPTPLAATAPAHHKVREVPPCCYQHGKVHLPSGNQQDALRDSSILYVRF